MPKASDADKEHFRSVLPDHPEVVVKPMFGNLGAFVNGNMFAGLFGPTSEIIATFSWILAVSFVATGAFLIAAAPIEACERED